ncbi:MAG: DUF1792 domain-containing protein [Clostridia bacterium]|nr:DUF1792 domain-containing protein [Clostridia bacterium]
MRLFTRIGIRIRVLFSLLRVPFGARAKILTPSETADRITEGKSLIRIGDGEMRLMRGLSLGFEVPSDGLVSELKEVREIFSRMGDGCPYLLCVPRKFMNASALSLMKKRHYVSSWAEARFYFKRHFSRSVTYGDAFIFSKDYPTECDRILTYLGQRPVIFVHNSRECFERFKEAHGGAVHYLPCPDTLAYEKIDELESAVYSIAQDNGYGPGDVRLVVSAGPCAKPLVMRTSKRGYQAIDTGHLFDRPLEDMK